MKLSAVSNSDILSDSMMMMKMMMKKALVRSNFHVHGRSEYAKAFFLLQLSTIAGTLAKFKGSAA